MVLTIQVLNLTGSDSKALYGTSNEWAHGFDALCSDEIVLTDQWDLFTHIPWKYFINTGAMANNHILTIKSWCAYGGWG